jgi:hypothetical protein
MYVGLITLASVYYVFLGRHHFVAPVALVRRDGITLASGARFLS